MNAPSRTVLRSVLLLLQDLLPLLRRVLRLLRRVLHHLRRVLHLLHSTAVEESPWEGHTPPRPPRPSLSPVITVTRDHGHP